MMAGGADDGQTGHHGEAGGRGQNVAGDDHDGTHAGGDAGDSGQTGGIGNTGHETEYPLVRYHVFVRGLVQGVWFRESTRHEALALGVSGWVRNLADGRVEAVFEGPAASVEALLTWAERGPVHARVDRLERDPEPVRGESGFLIL